VLGFLPVLLFESKGEGEFFLQNVKLFPNYKMLTPPEYGAFFFWFNPWLTFRL
jgi:hypothetical protein